MSPPMSATRSPRWCFDGQIALARRHVHTRHRHPNRVAQAEASAGAAAGESNARGIQHEIVVEVETDADEPIDRDVVELDEEAVRNQAGDDTRTLLAKSPLQKPQTLH